MDTFTSNENAEIFEVTPETVYGLYYAAEQITEDTPQSEICMLLGLIEDCKRKTTKFLEALRCLQNHLRDVFQEVLNGNSPNRPALMNLRDFLRISSERLLDELATQID